jgi:Tfp pilus assembly protein PilO
VNRRIAMFAGGAMIVLLGAWFMLLWSPKGSELDAARTRKETAEAKANELQVKLDRLKDGQRRSPELLAARDRLVSAVPEHPQLAEFILDTNDAATKAGVDFVSISPTAVSVSKVPGGPPSVAVSLEVSGDYAATLNFLDRLAELPRIVVLDEVQMTPGEEGKLTAHLGGNIFTTEEPAVPVAAGAPTAAATTATSTTTTTVAP